jgi:ketosteroid isomerase-like protein
MQARDWDGLGRLLAEDLVVEWPDTRVRIRGRDRYVEFNREYPGGWTIEVLAIVSAGSTVVSEVRVPHEARGVYYVVSILQVAGGRVVRGREYWLEERVERLSAERERWFESF